MGSASLTVLLTEAIGNDGDALQAWTQQALKKKDLQKWGYTNNCSRCRLIMTENMKAHSRVRHSPECRARLGKVLRRCRNARVDRARQDRFRRYRDKQPEGEAADERDERREVHFAEHDRQAP